jgi:hypothetical protein
MLKTMPGMRTIDAFDSSIVDDMMSNKTLQLYRKTNVRYDKRLQVVYVPTGPLMMACQRGLVAYFPQPSKCGDRRDGRTSWLSVLLMFGTIPKPFLASLAPRGVQFL